MKSGTSKDVVDEFRANVNIPGVTVAVLGLSYYFSHELLKVTEDRESAYRVCMLMQRCHGGSLYDYLARNELTLPQTLRLAERVADHLCALKRHRIVWRDLKAQNMLVVDGAPVGTSSQAPRTPAAALSRAPRVVLSDWGTSVVVPASGNRRMTINPIGTPGYIAPETGRINSYGYECDMFAWLLFAALLCVSHDQREALEDAVADLGLETKWASPAKLERKLKETLRAYAPHVRDECKPLWDLVVGTGEDAPASCVWVDVARRWTCEQAGAHVVALRNALCATCASTQKAAPVVPKRVPLGALRPSSARNNKAGESGNVLSKSGVALAKAAEAASKPTARKAAPSRRITRAMAASSDQENIVAQ